MQTPLRLRRARRLLAGAALLLIPIVVVLAPGWTAAPGASASESVADVPFAQQVAAGGSIASTEVPLPKLAEKKDVQSSEAGARSVGSSDAARDFGSNVRVTAVDAFYDVAGTDASTIAAALQRQGPRDGSGAWAGSLSWTFNWTYQPVREGGSCRATAAAVDLRLTYTLPRLASSVEPSPVVRERWERFLVALRYHEDGHAALAVEAADELARDIEAAPPARSCPELQSTVESTAQASLARHQDAQAVYDEQTGHGAAQGARFSYRDAESIRP